MDDLEAAVAAFLMSQTGVQAYVEKPGKDVKAVPTDYLVITQTGGGSNLFDQVQLDVDCYAPKKRRKRAKATATAVCAAAADLGELPNVFNPSVTNVYRQNDPDTGEARYVVQLEVYVCN